MYNTNHYMGCDRCNLFISKKFMNDPFCPDCGEKLRPIKYYDIDELESRRYLYKQCYKCDSIFFKKERCLICRTLTLKRYR